MTKKNPQITSQKFRYKILEFKKNNLILSTSSQKKKGMKSY
jgi:hypothetical protein